MPIDPFFTAKVKDDRKEKWFSKVSFAKAMQAKRLLRGAPQKTKKKAWRKISESPKEMTLRHLVTFKRLGSKGPITGGHALTGFKQPHKKWSEHRSSQHPH